MDWTPLRCVVLNAFPKKNPGYLEAKAGAKVLRDRNRHAVAVGLI
jgi:hypothetical protein